MIVSKGNVIRKSHNVLRRYLVASWWEPFGSRCLDDYLQIATWRGGLGMEAFLSGKRFDLLLECWKDLRVFSILWWQSSSIQLKASPQSCSPSPSTFNKLAILSWKRWKYSHVHFKLQALKNSLASLMKIDFFFASLNSWIHYQGREQISFLFDMYILAVKLWKNSELKATQVETEIEIVMQNCVLIYIFSQIVVWVFRSFS
jgi:hypothetical protein